MRTNGAPVKQGSANSRRYPTAEAQKNARQAELDAPKVPPSPVKYSFEYKGPTILAVVLVAIGLALDFFFDYPGKDVQMWLLGIGGFFGVGAWCIKIYYD